jgi:outer membrane protein TolC
MKAQNPDVRAALLRSEATQAKILPASAFEDSMIGIEFYNFPKSTVDVTQSEDIDYRIEQKIPFPGKRENRRKEAEFEYEVSKAGAERRYQEILFDLKKTYYRLYEVDRTLDAIREYQQTLKILLASAKTGYATGLSTLDAPLKAEIELSMQLNEETALTTERTGHEAHLLALLNRKRHGEAIALPAKLFWKPLVLSLEEVLAIAVRKRPDLRELEWLERRDESSIAVARQNRLPDFTVGLAYKQMLDNGEDVWAGSLMMNVPLLNWKAKKLQIKEKEVQQKATAFERLSLEIHTEHEVTGAYHAIKASEKNISRYKDGLLPQAKTMLTTATDAYRAGRIEFITLMEAARSVQEIKKSFYETEAALGMAHAELERLAGIQFHSEKETL